MALAPSGSVAACALCKSQRLIVQPQFSTCHLCTDNVLRKVFSALYAGAAETAFTKYTDMFMSSNLQGVLETLTLPLEDRPRVDAAVATWMRLQQTARGETVSLSSSGSTWREPGGAKIDAGTFYLGVRFTKLKQKLGLLVHGLETEVIAEKGAKVIDISSRSLSSLHFLVDDSIVAVEGVSVVGLENKQLVHRVAQHPQHCLLSVSPVEAEGLPADGQLSTADIGQHLQAVVPDWFDLAPALDRLLAAAPAANDSAPAQIAFHVTQLRTLRGDTVPLTTAALGQRATAILGRKIRQTMRCCVAELLARHKESFEVLSLPLSLFSVTLTDSDDGLQIVVALQGAVEGAADALLALRSAPILSTILPACLVVLDGDAAPPVLHPCTSARGVESARRHCRRTRGESAI
eukprot:m.30507 g.30507  ORF g.30507 m.30507 type:complete len:406 (+) comp4783_c0_seq2:3-1220(+)